MKARRAERTKFPASRIKPNFFPLQQTFMRLLCGLNPYRFLYKLLQAPVYLEIQTQGMHGRSILSPPDLLSFICSKDTVGNHRNSNYIDFVQIFSQVHRPPFRRSHPLGLKCLETQPRGYVLSFSSLHISRSEMRFSSRAGVVPLSVAEKYP